MDLDCNLNIEKDLDNVKESECDKDFDKFNKITKDQATQVIFIIYKFKKTFINQIFLIDSQI